MAAAQLQLIADALNTPPFSENLSLVALDEKSAYELLVLAGRVLAEIGAIQHEALRDVQAEELVERVVQFLRVMKYRSAETMDKVKEGSKSEIVAILSWTLQRLPELRKRTYLARFLVGIRVPDELMQDEMVAEAVSQLEGLQEEFKQIHKVCDALEAKQTEQAAAELRQEVKHLSDEKMHLEGKIAKIKERLSGVSNLKRLYAATSALRIAQEEEALLADRAEEQQSLLERALATEDETEKRVDALRKLGASANAGKILAHLRADVEASRRAALQTLPATIAAHQRSVNALRWLSEARSVSEADLEAAHADVQQLSRDVSDLVSRFQARRDASSDDKVRLYRQQAGVVERKLADARERARQLQRVRSELEAQIASSDSSRAEDPSMRVPTGEEFNKFAADLRAKRSTYQKLKADLDVVQTEGGVLARTSQVLESRAAELEHALQEKEAELGVEGYHSTEQTLEEVSKSKSVLDQKKEKTLEEISRLVSEISSKIKKEKTRLAPRIKELRGARTKAQETERAYIEKKSTYDTLMVGFDAEINKLKQQIELYSTDLQRDESRLHQVALELELAQARDEVVGDELRASLTSTRAKSGVIATYEAHLKTLAQTTNSLREEHQKVMDTHADRLYQKKLAEGLVALLSKKLRCIEKEKDQDLALPADEGMTYGEVNRVVFE